ncbi:MAG: 4Fe-4S dicluster domain-containing protein [Candidatus Eisenbacteria sp.]|nr:4Fe-4S dicluster domain-containing protein [Candidatus Eisenbacteria bacterium]
MSRNTTHRVRYGMAIDIDRCTGCGACMVACAVENNVSVPPPPAGDRKGLTWIRVYRLHNERPYPESRTAYLPLLCQHCGHHTPCVSVCPQHATDIDPETGIVSQIPERCLGCRYCMAACPYHARYFTWWDPVWPAGMEEIFNPDVSPRMRGVVEKCNFCHGRRQVALQRAAAEGRRQIRDDEYRPACLEACPVGAIHFGNLDDPKQELYDLVHGERAFRLLERLGTEPKIYYLSSQPWVRRLLHNGIPASRRHPDGGRPDVAALRHQQVLARDPRAEERRRS